jgi:hypothetical protein
MGKPSDRTPGKKPPAPSAKVREPAGPTSLGAMRGLGPRSLDVTCEACGHRTLFNVDDWPDEVLVSSFGPRMRCARCGHLGASVRPHWSRLYVLPGGRAATRPDIKADIAAQLYAALERLGADQELLAIVGSMNDTLTDKDVLRMLEEYNRTGKVLHQPQ